jgi:hypothetical protein
MRRRLSVLLGAMVLLVAALMVAAVPPVFAQGEGCYYGQQHAFTNAFLRDNDEQAVKHLGKIGDCVTR